MLLVIGLGVGLQSRALETEEHEAMTDHDARTLAALQTVDALARLTVPAETLDALRDHEREIAAEQERRACA